MTASNDFIALSIAVLTVSDTRTPETDTSGRVLVELLTAAGHRLHERLIVKDDGVGFDPDRQGAKRIKRGDLGLLSIRERAASVGGGVKIRSVCGGGTEIEARIPVPAVADKNPGTER